MARRKEDDIAVTNAAFYVKMTADNIVNDAELVFGGMSSTVVVAHKTKSLIINSAWTENMVLDDVYLELLKDLPLASNAPGGMVAYRKTLALRCEEDNYYSLPCNTIESFRVNAIRFPKRSAEAAYSRIID